VIRVYRTGTDVAEFRPGIDQVNVEWDVNYSTGWVRILYSRDGGATWNDTTSRIAPGQSRIEVSVNQTSFLAPAGVPTVNAKVMVQMFETEVATDEIYEEISDDFVVTPWPDGFIKAVFPASIAEQSTSDSSMVIVGLGDSNLVPNGHLFRATEQYQVDRLFPPHTTVNKAWRLARLQNGVRDIYLMRAGDYHEYLNLGDGSPRSYQYVYNAYSIAYQTLSRVRFGTLCAPDAIADLYDVGMDNLLAVQLADFCYEHSKYVHPIAAVLPATTVRRCKEVNAELNKETVPEGSVPVSLMQLRGGSVVQWEGTGMPGVGLISASFGTVGGFGVVEYNHLTYELTWTEPGGGQGTPQVVAPGGTYSLFGSKGNTLSVLVTSLPASTVFSDMRVSYYPIHPGAKFLYSVYGYTRVVYNDPITGARVEEDFNISSAAGAVLSSLPEEVDPLNKPIKGLDSRSPVLFEAFIATLKASGVNAVRHTIAKGNTLGTNVTMVPVEDNNGNKQGWSSIKNLRVANQIIRSIKYAVEGKFLGRQRVPMKQVEAVAKAACRPYVGVSIHDFSLAAIQIDIYEAQIDLVLVVIGTLEELQFAVNVGV